MQGIELCAWTGQASKKQEAAAFMVLLLRYLLRCCTHLLHKHPVLSGQYICDREEVVSCCLSGSVLQHSRGELAPVRCALLFHTSLRCFICVS